MPSEKKEDKKKAHHKKKKKRSRSWEGKHKRRRSREDENRAKKSEDGELNVDICNYANDPAELLSRVFSCIGEDSIAEATPPIFKMLDANFHGKDKSQFQSLQKLELMKLCHRELIALPMEAVIRILHGSSAEDCPVLKRKRSHEQDNACGEGTSKDLLSSCTPAMDDSSHKSSLVNPERNESKDIQGNVTKKNNSSNQEIQILKSSLENKVDENENNKSLSDINLSFLQPVPEVMELEYRARAIRSMIANIDKINEKSFERNYNK